jgi:hypothetical protein
MYNPYSKEEPMEPQDTITAGEAADRLKVATDDKIKVVTVECDCTFCEWVRLQEKKPITSRR